MEVPAVPVSALGAGPTGDSSAEIRRRVIAARTRQAERFAGTTVRANSALQYRMVE